MGSSFFQDAKNKAVNLDEDKDTIAELTSALVEIYNWYENIPKD
jgi:ADP-ribosylglycohydrolase